MKIMTAFAVLLAKHAGF